MNIQYNFVFQKKDYWERLIHTDEQRRILLPSDFNGIWLKENVNVPFHILKNKCKYDFSITMCHSKTKHGFSLFDFKMYRPNLITNDGFVNHHQKTYRGYKVPFPNIIIKMRTETHDKK